MLPSESDLRVSGAGGGGVADEWLQVAMNELPVTSRSPAAPTPPGSGDACSALRNARATSPRALSESRPGRPEFGTRRLQLVSP